MLPAVTTTIQVDTSGAPMAVHAACGPFSVSIPWDVRVGRVANRLAAAMLVRARCSDNKQALNNA